MGGFDAHVAVVDTAPGAQADNAANIASLTGVIQRNPRDASAYNTRGVVYAKLGQYSNAIQDFSHTIALNPNFSGAYTNRALAYRQTNKNDLAMQDFNQAIAVNPNDAAAYLGRGNLRRSQNDFTGALADLNQSIRLNPEGAQAYHARGLIYQRQGDNVQAITDFNNAIDRDPFAGAPYQARGQSLMATGQYEKAIEDFNAALNVNANISEAWAGLGYCYEKLNNRPKALEVLLARDSGRSRQRGGARGDATPGLNWAIVRASLGAMDAGLGACAEARKLRTSSFEGSCAACHSPGARRLIAPLFQGSQTRRRHLRPAAAARDALHSRRLHVQFNVIKGGVLERALVAPVALECACPRRPLIAGRSGNDLVFADNMAAGIGPRHHGGIVRYEGTAREIIRAVPGPTPFSPILS